MHKAPLNLLIATLPLEQRTLLMRQLEPIVLPMRSVLFQPDLSPKYVHFLTSGLASNVVYMKQGEACEVGLIGCEGLSESLHLLGSAMLQTNCFMQISGTGLRMKFKDFERLFQHDEIIRRAVLRFVQLQTLVLSQICACNRLHEVEERLARWLLMVSDRVGSNELHLTQEFLSQMLGARRSTVTLVAGALQRSGMIEYTRGQVTLLDREALEGTACECYGITCEALRRFSQPMFPEVLV